MSTWKCFHSFRRPTATPMKSCHLVSPLPNSNQEHTFHTRLSCTASKHALHIRSKSITLTAPYMGTTADTTSGGRLAASVMIFNTVSHAHKRPERRRKSCYFNEQRAKSVLSITGCGQTFNPAGLSCQDDDHSQHGGFPTKISHP